MVDVLEKHSELKEKVKNVILRMEEHEALFTQEDIIKHAERDGLEAEDVREMIIELIADKYIHEVIGTAGPLFARTVWRDYSPAFEERPEV